MLRVREAHGTLRRVFRFRATLKGETRIWQLGDYPQLKVLDARKLHGDCLHAVKRGEDPQPLIDRWHASTIPGAGTSDGPTVADVMAEFMRVAARTRKRPEAAQAMIDSDVLPHIGDRPVAGLRKRDFVELLDRIVARGSSVQANRVQALLRQAFAVAADRDLIDIVPAMPRGPVGGEETPRDRVLTDEEIVKVWHGLDTLSPKGKIQHVSRQVALALKLLLVTAQRRGEVASAKWSDISETTVEVPGPDGKPQRITFKVWTISDTKNDRPHAIPLSPLACHLLDELRELAGKSAEWLPSRRTGKANAERDRSITRGARAARERLEMTDWTPHDLRRTARTNMARLGVSDAVAEKVLNHVAGNRMVAVYNRHAYLLEMRDALDAWAVHVEQLVAAAPK
jgi:integrase